MEGTQDSAERAGFEPDAGAPLELPHELNVRMQVTNHGDSEIGLLWNGAESLQERAAL